ncbi:MAG: hypothetical protein JWR80_8015 [Bradyrhizobium sp.]|nr:hypothetical protein [Bradyrhizobium sp.]
MRASIFEFDGRIKEDKGQQFLSGRGLYNDGFTEIRRLEPHGFYSSPPKGSQGLLFYPNGNADEAFVLGVDHPSHRPAGLPPGSGALYDASGNIIKLVGNGLEINMQSNTITVTSGNWTVTAPEVTINGNLKVNGNVVVTGTVIDGDGNNGA